MKLKILSLIVGLALLALTAGCSSGTSVNNTPNADAQKKVIATYLEGLKDRDYDKLKGTVSYSIYQSWPKELTEFEEMLADRQKAIGDIKSWTLEEQPYVDEINNQTIVRATVITDTYKVILKMDLRKDGDQWRVYGVDTENAFPLAHGEENTK